MTLEQTFDMGYAASRGRHASERKRLRVGLTYVTAPRTPLGAADRRSTP